MGSIARAGWCWRRGRGWGTAPPMINDGGAPAGGVGRGDPAGRPYQYGGSPLPIWRVAPTNTAGRPYQYGGSPRRQRQQ